jgi:TBC1 domain family member 13
LINILFVYAKLHPAVRYVQGMNELVGTMFYVFASDEALGNSKSVTI